MKYNFNNYIVKPPKGFFLYMYALAFYFSFYTINKKVEERLDAGEKDGWKIIEAVCRDPEIQDETCGNQFALYAHGYKLSDCFWDTNEKAKLPKWEDQHWSQLQWSDLHWEDDNWKEPDSEEWNLKNYDGQAEDCDPITVGFELRARTPMANTPKSETAIAGLLTPKNWDRLSAVTDKPWPKNPLMEAFLSTHSPEEKDFELWKNRLYETGLPLIMEHERVVDDDKEAQNNLSQRNHLSLLDLGELGKWLKAFKYMPEWSLLYPRSPLSIPELLESEVKLYLAFAIAYVLQSYYSLAEPFSAEEILSNNIRYGALPNLLTTWEELKLGVPLGSLYDNLHGGKDSWDFIDYALIEEPFLEVVLDGPWSDYPDGVASSLIEIWKANPRKKMEHILIELYDSWCEAGEYIDRYREDCPDIKDNIILATLFSQIVTNDVYERLPPELQKKFVRFYKKLGLCCTAS